MSRRPCRFYTTAKGCFKGDNCPQAHIGSLATPSPSPNASTSSRQSSQGRRTSQTAPPTYPTSGQVPRGACTTFWSTGQCNREFSCRSRHISPPSTGNDVRPIGESAASSTINHIAPFLTEAGLAKITGSGTDGFYSVNASNGMHSPTDVRNSIQKFLRDNFRFNTTFDIYAFLVLLTSASTTNSSWVSAKPH